MKKILLFLSFYLFFGFFSTAQDIISLKNGEKVKGKVLEIGIKEIRYKAFNNLDGPIITIKKSSVSEIIYENGTHDIINKTIPFNSLPPFNKSKSINKSRSDTIPKQEIIPKSSFFISSNFRLFSVPYDDFLQGFGVTLGIPLFSKKLCDYIGLGIENFYIRDYYPLGVNYKIKHVSIYFSNKILFSKHSRRFKPYLLTDLGWSFILNKKEIRDEFTRKYPNSFIHPRNGLYIKPGLGLDFLINSNHSVFFDLCFDMNFTDLGQYNYHFELFNSHEKLFFLFRIGYLFKI